jgi:hypothetical protein
VDVEMAPCAQPPDTVASEFTLEQRSYLSRNAIVNLFDVLQLNRFNATNYVKSRAFGYTCDGQIDTNPYQAVCPWHQRE